MPHLKGIIPMFVVQQCEPPTSTPQPEKDSKTLSKSKPSTKGRAKGQTQPSTSRTQPSTSKSQPSTSKPLTSKGKTKRSKPPIRKRARMYSPPSPTSSSSSSSSSNSFTTSSSSISNSSSSSSSSSTDSAPLEPESPRPESPPHPNNMKTRDAQSLVEQVKYTFLEQPDKYADFLHLMKQSKDGAMGLDELVDNVSVIFEGYPELMRVFNQFLPGGVKIDN